jgi:hypothetical protein
MIRHLLSTLTLALVSTALFAAPQAGADMAAAAKGSTGTLAFTGGLKLQKLYHDVGSAGGAAIPAAIITPYGSTLNVSCTNTAGCYIVIEAEAQVASTATEASTALCVRVNGVSTDGCPFLTRTSTVGFTSFNHRGGVSVPTGNHVVTTHIYTGVASALYNYNTEVKLLKK